MSYQLTHINNTSFIHKNYSEQIKALELFFKETNTNSIPISKIKFGGGTALSIYYFQHRLSFDIDLFVEDGQYLDFLRPKLWIEESSNFNANEYIDQYNHIGLVTSNDIKVDILTDMNSTEYFIDDTKKIFPFDIYIESIENILAKKITFRKTDNKARDIFDLATAISKDKFIIQNMLKSDKIMMDDILILQKSIENLNHKKYMIEIEIVEPFEEFKTIAKNAQHIILENITDTLNQK